MMRFWRLKRGKGRKKRQKLRRSRKKKSREIEDHKLPTTLEDHPDKSGRNTS